MYEEFIEDLPAVQKSAETFLIKGLKLPFYASNNTIVKAVGNYYSKRENFVLFTPPRSGKFTGILEIVKNLHDYVVFVDKKMVDQFCAIKNVHANSARSVDEFDFKESRAKFLIFYNTKIPFEKLCCNDVHISGFYDYVGLYNPEDYKSYIQSQISHFPCDYVCTVICKRPKQKRVEFVFGTDSSLKHLSIFNIAENERCMSEFCKCSVFVKHAFAPAVANHLKDQKIEIIDKIANGFKTDKLIFYDIDLGAIPTVLDCVDHIVIVYTKDDFNTLKEIYQMLKDKNIEIPHFIKKIAT